MSAASRLLVVAVLLLVTVPLVGDAPAQTPGAPSDCAAQVDGLLPHGRTGGRDAVLMIHGWTGRADAWTEPISLATNAINQPIDRSLVDQIKRFDDTDVWLLDYQRYSARWVTDDRVGGTVAAAIDCLADAYERPIGIVAHSMGGLAVRQVAADDDRANRIAAVVTLGTPHTGSAVARAVAWVLGLDDDMPVTAALTPRALQTIATVVEFCGRLTTIRLDACGSFLEPLWAFDSDAGKALRTGSDELRVLPAFPAGVPTKSLAGEIEVTTRASQGLFYRDLGSVSLGDAIVTSSSAVLPTGRQHVARCRHAMEAPLAVPGTHRLQVRVGELLGTRDFDPSEHDGLRELVATPCFHTRLSQTVELTNSAIGFLYEHLKESGAGESRLVADTEPQTVNPRTMQGTPVMIVLDVSGSMNDRDGTGTVRLDGARTAVAEMVRELRPGTPFAIRSYPDPALPDCNGGRDVVPLSPLDPTRTTAVLDTLAASGNTPTGPALIAAMDTLRAAGYAEGQLVLVSDGQSNCGEPPCDVAQSVRAEGFDVTVNTIGFQTSAAGRDELTCIAGATDGRHVDAEDSQALAEELRALSGAQLVVSIDHPHVTPSGLPTTVDVTVRNTGLVPADAAELSLSFDDPLAGAILPTVFPPRFALGNVPPGEQVARTWTLVPGVAGQTGSAAGRVVVSAAGAQPVSERFVVDIAADADIADAGTFLAGARGRVAFLGDGFSAGAGATGYLAASEGSTRSDDADDLCRRSHDTYGVSLFGADRVDILACADAVTANLYQPQAGRPGVPAQLAALEALPTAPDLALLTLGWSDVGLGGMLERCILSDACHEDVGQLHGTLRDIELLVGPLTNAYEDVAARLAPTGTVAVVSYPLLFPVSSSASCTGFDAAEVIYLNHVVRQLNAAAKRAVAAAAGDGHQVVFVSLTEGAALPSNTACHPDAFVNSIDGLLAHEAQLRGTTEEEAVDVRSVFAQRIADNDPAWQSVLHHPTAQGYQAMTYALVQAFRTAASSSVDARSETMRTGAPQPSRSVVLPVSSGRGVTVDVREGVAVDGTDVRHGDRLGLIADGFAPGSEVRVRLHPTAVTFAAVRADADGRVDARVAIPPSTPVGHHRVVMRGIDASFTDRERVHAVRVRSDAPPWLFAATVGAGLSGLLAVAGIVALLRMRGRRPAD